MFFYFTVMLRPNEMFDSKSIFFFNYPSKMLRTKLQQKYRLLYKKHAFSNTYECYYYSRFDMDSIRGWKMMKMAHIFRFYSHIVDEKKIRNHFSVTKYKMRLRTMTCLLYILDLFHRCKVAFFCHCSSLTIAPYAHRIPKVRRKMNE